MLSGGWVQQEAPRFGDYHDRSSSSCSWETNYSETELRAGSSPGKGGCASGSPLSHFQAFEGQRAPAVSHISLAGLSLEDHGATPFAQDDRFPPPGEQQSVGWGGRPLQQQRGFRGRGEEGPHGGYHQMQRGRPAYPRGKQAMPNQRPARGGHDGRVKNQGYRRLWQQVTQVRRRRAGGQDGRRAVCRRGSRRGVWVLGSRACLGATRRVPSRGPRRGSRCTRAAGWYRLRARGLQRARRRPARAGRPGAEAGGQRQHPLQRDDGGGPAGDRAAAAARGVGGQGDRAGARPRGRGHGVAWTRAACSGGCGTWRGLQGAKPRRRSGSRAAAGGAGSGAALTLRPLHLHVHM